MITSSLSSRSYVACCGDFMRLMSNVRELFFVVN